MRSIITVTEMRSMPGRYRIQSDMLRTRRGVMHPREAWGAETAAAEAMQLALGAERGYQIFAPAAVLKLIPSDMRQRG